MPKKLVVDAQTCIGCGTCAALAANTFKMQDGKSIVTDTKGDSEDTIQSAIDSCPVDAISWSENED
jgi:ferredoxin